MPSIHWSKHGYIACKCSLVYNKTNHKIVDVVDDVFLFLFLFLLSARRYLVRLGFVWTHTDAHTLTFTYISILNSYQIGQLYLI